jgi:hypothetical protein
MLRVESRMAEQSKSDKSASAPHHELTVMHSQDILSTFPNGSRLNDHEITWEEAFNALEKS